ncbi:hypothetical protein OAX78_02115 [Planctomycetota bacterium]|nr:hypothetical protein [Planctomycetota bacterium]
MEHARDCAPCRRELVLAGVWQPTCADPPLGYRIQLRLDDVVAGTASPDLIEHAGECGFCSEQAQEEVAALATRTAELSRLIERSRRPVALEPHEHAQACLADAHEHMERGAWLPAEAALRRGLTLLEPFPTRVGDTAQIRAALLRSLAEVHGSLGNPGTQLEFAYEGIDLANHFRPDASEHQRLIAELHQQLAAAHKSLARLHGSAAETLPSA